MPSGGTEEGRRNRSPASSRCATTMGLRRGSARSSDCRKRRARSVEIHPVRHDEIDENEMKEAEQVGRGGGRRRSSRRRE